MVFFESALFFAGLLILLRSSDVFVESSVRLAKLFGVSAFVIGLTVVAVGTSIPELATSVNAVIKESGGIALGIIIGSNISNIGLILAIALFLGGAIKAEKKLFDKDLFMMLVVTVLFFYFLSDGLLSFFEGVFLLLFFVVHTFFLFQKNFEFRSVFRFESYIKSVYGVGSFLFNTSVYRELLKQGLDPKTYSSLVRDEPDVFVDEVEKSKRLSGVEKKEFEEKYRSEIFSRIVRSVIVLFFGFAGIWVGSELTIIGAVFLADLFYVSKELVGFTVIAVGTSLPELSVSLASVKKGIPSILFGNIIGSNIANILLIGGLASVIGIVSSPIRLISAPLILLLCVSVLLWLSVFGSWKISRVWGVAFFGAYMVFLYLVVSGKALA